MCACDEGRKCAAHRALPDHRRDDDPDEDPRDDAERMRDAFSEGRSAYDPANDAD